MAGMVLAMICDGRHGFCDGFGDVGEASGDRELNRANVFTARHRPYMYCIGKNGDM